MLSKAFPVYLKECYKAPFSAVSAFGEAWFKLGSRKARHKGGKYILRNIHGSTGIILNCTLHVRACERSGYMLRTLKAGAFLVLPGNWGILSFCKIRPPCKEFSYTSLLMLPPIGYAAGGTVLAFHELETAQSKSLFGHSFWAFVWYMYFLHPYKYKTTKLRWE